MKFPWSKPKTKILDTWEYAPYAFEPGRIYVMEVDITALKLEELQSIDNYFKKHGVNVKLVPSRIGQRVLHPVEVARMTKEEE